MRARILVTATILGLALQSLARAESREQRYLSTRDAAIAKVSAAMDSYTAMPAEPRKAKSEALHKISTMDEAERAKLEEQMRDIVGPMEISGFGPVGKLNFDGLIKGDQGFGTLDGLKFTSMDNKASVIVTTTDIFRRWLAEHKDWWGTNGESIPQQPGRAVQVNAFYTQSLLTDSAIIGFTELHIRKPLGSIFVFAMLGGRTQDAVPSQANEIFIAVGRGGRVFIGQSRGIDAVGPVAACDGARKAALDYRPSTDQKAKELQSRFLKCFSGWARYQPNYSEAVRAAQQLIDGVAAR